MKLHGAKALLSVAVVLSTVSMAVGQTPMAQNSVDPTLPVYERAGDLKGELTFAGSNTMSQVASTWGEHFRRIYPDVQINIQIVGSTNAVDSVVNQTSDMGLLSRSITEGEVRGFYNKFGYVPTVLTPVLEPQGIFVHKDNPVESLSLSQLDAIFSTTLKRGEKKTARTWGDVGVTGKWASVAILPQGRSETTGSQVFFNSAILGDGEFRPDMVSHESNPLMIEAISKDPRSIGFTGSTFDSPDVKLVPISWKTGEPAVDVHSSSYPLVRRLQLVVNNNPKQPLSPLQAEFIKYVFSRSGQRDVVISGFLPVPSGAANIALQAIGEKTLN